MMLTLCSINYISHAKWSIPKSYRDNYSCYFILDWKQEYLLAAIKDGAILKDRAYYQVRYYRMIEKELFIHPIYLLSFRKPVDNRLDPIVLITPKA